MTDATLDTDTKDIVVDEIFPHPAPAIWRALTSGELMKRWIMPPSGFEPVVGCRFTFQTTPAGAWDGVIHCRVLEVRRNERFAYSWTGGHESNAGYGSKLDTVVTWTLSEAPGGTRLRLVHSGFALPRNDSAFKTMGDGWKKVVPRLRATVDEGDAAGVAAGGGEA
ncbi:MAG: SRPBCC domain-containing protein [Microvirga sp.]